FTLPATSTNGITGTWSPAVNNTATTTYTFTPNEGQCATTTTMTVTVGNNIVPTFTQIAPICSGTSFTLPVTSTNGITGTWSPAVNSTATTTYTFTPNAGQCATAANMTVEVTSIDTAVTVFSNTITATTSSLGATYQWIDCANNQPIAGETDFFYVAMENGSYSVIITENGCSATSECTVISGLGIKPVVKSNWKLYPNPTSDVLFIDTNETLDIVITDMTGKTIIHQRLKLGENSIKVSNLSSGVYIVNSDSGMHAKFIKK
ncbi:T9SS type A sorting domain-containing protein, partial [Flavobacterium sp. RNTU_13]|uniref:T9SS type A sorting domain-containing protein n=1 Tax=Flavobacterium sp. RNTU_13 TaxID=3375145 RepID=UPI003985F623